MNTTAHLQSLLDRLRDGDDSARTALLDNSLERLRLLARKMFPRSHRLRRLEETDDLVQRVMLRLWKALEEVKPADVKTYVGLAALQIRRILVDLVRRKDATIQLGDYEQHPPAPEGEPTNLLLWAEFHERIDGMPGELKEVFDLCFYGGLTQIEAAELIALPERTLKRRWQEAKIWLGNALQGHFPPMNDDE